ncbi:uncharacterized protein DUF4307 [Humibacillus xanthopallidus]|uniref:Uncharacterized protein DUF4307 n=1 Tax=Humibacillus xanthopallidus TaxID=412689 RepID=A0A543PXZ8_9MICO|nr:DUF4307 domain-containing protein [Humibacillus xanthopallidus]TQN48949.1 uncharacterized protein DUF4307 [Humibacillus xanthopallidus]
MPSRPTLPHPAPGTAKWWVIGTLGVAAGVAVAVWFGISSTVGLASFTTTGYKVLDDQSVRVTFELNRPADKPTTCTIQALARDFAPVGSIDVTYSPPPAGTGSLTTSETVTLRTTSRAVTGEVKTCS